MNRTKSTKERSEETETEEMTSSELDDARKLDAELVSVGANILANNSTTKSEPSDDMELYHDADATYVHPTSGAKLYTGNIRAAQSREMMRKYNIRLIVNAQGMEATNFHESDAELTYVRFPVAFWRTHLHGASNEKVIQWFQPLFDAIDAALDRGDSVLVHCLAGAHRAATITAAYIRYKLGIPPHELQTYLRARRPIVQLLPGLYEVLLRLDAALSAATTTTTTTTTATTSSSSTTNSTAPTVAQTPAPAL